MNLKYQIDLKPKHTLTVIFTFYLASHKIALDQTRP